ncbi:hypothetical protein BGZ81_011856 [Podila clonocystis]|nr:hypothetical protein BGZ81_011856 [Podila clonocystis]
MSTILDTSSLHSCLSSDDVLKSIARELEAAGINDSIHHQAPESRNQRFHLQSFLTTPERAAYLFPNSKTYQSIHVQERLILLSAETKDRRNVLAAGLEVLEYTLVPYLSSDTSISLEPVVPERFVYIAKVDTSGNWPIPGSELQMKSKRSPVRALVHGYLKAMRSHKISISSASLSVTDNPSLSTCTPKTSLFIFARAQPQYLFARSTKNPGKHVLDDRGLIRWWKNMVGSAYVKGDNNSGHERSIKASWHIPGCESERHAVAITQAGSPSASGEDTSDMWIYGHPYKGVTGKSRDIIPQFPDDPKSRMIQSDSTARGAVDASTFWEMVAISEECGAGRMTGFFRVIEERSPLEPVAKVVQKEEQVLELVGGATGSTEGVIKEEVSVNDKATVAPDYTDMINILLGLDFATLESSIESTQKWNSQVNRWMNMAKTRDSLRIQEGQVDVQLLVKCANVEIASSPVTTTPATIATSAINVLGAGMIKRKVATSSPTPTAPAAPSAPATTPAVHVLGAGMIKRKVTAAPPVNILGASLIKRKPATTPPPTTIKDVKRPKLEDTKPRILTIDPSIMDLDPPFQGTGAPQTTTLSLQGAVPPAPTSPPLGTILPPFFSRTPREVDTKSPLSRRKSNSGRSQLNVPTGSTSAVLTASTSTLPKMSFTSTVPMTFTSTVPMASTSTIPTATSTSTFPLPPLIYVPAEGFNTRARTAINDAGGATSGPGAQHEGITNHGQAPDSVMLPQPLLIPAFPINTTTIRSRDKAVVPCPPSPPPPLPPRDLHTTPQFHRPGYLFCFPDAPLPTLNEWVDYMTLYETYDPILARLREAMDDVVAYCHTSFAPFATPEHYRQRKEGPSVQRRAAPLFVVTHVIRDSIRTKDGTRPTDEAVKKKRRRMMQRIHEYLLRLLEMKNEGATPLERMDALEDMSNRELRRSGLFRTVITKMG